MPSGDPRKQERPGALDPIAELIAMFPPNVGGVVTEFGATVINFPGFRSGKAIQFEINSGPLVGRFILDPGAIDVVIEQLTQAKMKAESQLVPANLADMHQVARTNGERNGSLH